MQKFYIKNNLDIEKYMKVQETFYNGELLNTIEFIKNCASYIGYLNNWQSEIINGLLNTKNKSLLITNYNISLEQLSIKNKFTSKDYRHNFSTEFFILVDKYISTIKNTFQPRYGLQNKTNRANFLTNYLEFEHYQTTNYHITIPDSFVTKKHQLEINSNLKSIEELHSNYLLALELNQDYQKIVKEINNNKQFISKIDSFIEKTATQILNIQKIKNGLLTANLIEGIQTFFYQELSSLSPKVRKLRGLDLDLAKWEIVESNTKNNFFDTDAYIIVYKFNGVAQILSKHPSNSANLCNAQLFPTAKEATKVARRSTSYYGKNFTIVKIGLATKGTVHSEGEAITEVTEMNSLREKRDIEAFFECNKLDKIREKLKEYENHDKNTKNNIKIKSEFKI